ncbi:MAG: CBS domain-containing protein [Pseudomonadota bacterium]
MLVSQILKTKGSDVVSTTAEATINEAAVLMANNNVGAVLVRGGDGGAVVGILSERDVTRGLAKSGSAVGTARVGTLMSGSIVHCSPSDTSDSLMDLMTHKRIRHLPVLADGELVGMISIGDVVKARLSELQSQAAALETYIAGTG